MRRIRRENFISGGQQRQSRVISARREIIGKYSPSEKTKERVRKRQKRKGVLATETFGEITDPMRKYFPNAQTHDGSEKKIMLRYGVNARGSCFYHTINAVIDPQNYIESSAEKQMEMGRQFRTEVASNLATKWVPFWKSKGVSERKIPSVEQTRKEMLNFSVWADIFHIIFTVQSHLDLNIIVFDVNSGSLYCGTHNPNTTRPTILMAWISHSHFEPLVQWDSKEETIRTLFPHRNATLRHILEMYKASQCPRVSLHQLLSRRRRRRYGGGGTEEGFPFMPLCAT